MKTAAILILGLCVGFEANADEWDGDQGYEGYEGYQDSQTYEDPFREVDPDAYGMGVGSDQYGRPSEWRTQDGRSDSNAQDNVQRDGYGMGVGMDVYGRPVRAGQR